MGNERVMVRNIQVLEIDAEKNMMVVAGPVPGSTGGILEVRRAK
jgi:large subunit ribosomal protein L3